ncbi:MAG: amidohydrolase family protein [Gammaproteobacteria bacterium]|nr:amidohydrolase family protein [Gammaproteobacteria bacterium]
MADQPGPIVDADGHVLEPADTWEKYIDPEFRDRAIRIAHDDENREIMLFDNKPMRSLRGNLGALGGIELEPGELGRLNEEYTYEMGSPPGGYDPAARIAVLDEEGIDAVLLYPTIGICWEGQVTDPRLATAYTRAYNRWIADFCRHDPKRLYPVAHISLHDPEGAVEEVQRARKDGCVGVYLSPDPAARAGKQFTDPSLVRFWETAQDLDMPIGFHVVVRDDPAFNEYSGHGRDSALFFFAFLAIDVMAAFTHMISSGMFEKYPRLKCSVLEAGCNWIAAWLERMDHKHEVLSSTAPFKLKPSEYFYRQCLVSADPDEGMTAQVVEHIGADYVMWASDYPHIDASMGVVAELKRNIASLPAESQRKVLGENVLRFYGISDTAWN